MSDGENVTLKEYELVVDILTSESELFWQRFVAFLLLNSGLFAASTFLVQGRFAIQLILIICLVGFISSVIWFFIFGRARSWIVYYSEHAKAIEEKLERLTQATPRIFRGIDSYFKSCNRKFYEKRSITRLAICVPLIFCVLWIILAIMIVLFSSVQTAQLN